MTAEASSANSAAAAPAGALSEAIIQQLRASVRGEVILPGDAAYDSARAIFNGMIDRRPAAIVRCTGAADVIGAIRLARREGLPLAVRGGGHNVAGNALCDGGLVVDLSRMKGIRVDPAKRVAQAQPGLTWGEFDHETQAFGLATTGGLVSTTGIAGFTLGGGIGWLAREHGLTCDNLISADVVLPDGQLVHASETEHADLLWGLCGGGGNFGIVTSFELRLHPVGPMVTGGLVLHPIARARELLQFCRDYLAGAPDQLTALIVFLTAPPAPFVPAAFHGAKMAAVAVCYTGPSATAEEVLRPLKTFGPPVVEHIGPVPYVTLQSMFDASAPPGLQNYWKSEYITGLSDGVIDLLIDSAGQMASPLSAVHVHQLGGAISRLPEEATAFGHRRAPYLVNIIAMWPDRSAAAEPHVQWARSLWAALQPYSAGGAYVNFMTGEEGHDRVRAAYGQNYDRLAALKAKYDPTNLLRFNQNIRPAAAGEAA